MANNEICWIFADLLIEFQTYSVFFMRRGVMLGEQTHLKYRSEIDGLRALAVLSVIFYHLNENWIPGGFLGVDIFFVISGYLITNIITKEMVEGSFSFQAFYNRRIKRIFPVFIFVMLLASIFSTFFFIRSEGELQRKGIESGVLFFSNLYLANRQGYWDFAANENPILHIWSLAVEEQYYLFFPVFLYVAFIKTKNKNIFLSLSIILFVIFCMTYFLPEEAYRKIGVNNVYYASNIRFPELLVGSVCALLPTLKLKRILELSLFALIVACLWGYNKNLPFLLNGLLILPCALTAILILSMTNKSPVGKLLSLKPIVFIGKLSYSLYLFHWLFIAWANYLMGTTGKNEFSFEVTTLILILTVSCSLLSYYLLENPIRRSKLVFKQSLIFIYLIPSLFVIGLNQMTRSMIKDRTSMYQSVADLNIENSNSSIIALFGDSHASHLGTFADYIGEKEGWKAINVEAEQVCHIPITEDGNIVLGCENVVAELEKYPVIFLSMFYDLKRNNGSLPRPVPRDFLIENFEEKFKAFVTYFSKTKRVYVFADVKVASRSPLREAILKRYSLDGWLEPIQELGNKEESNQYVYNLVKDIPNVKWIDPTKYLPKGYFVDDLPLFSDQDHLSKFGSLYMAEQFYKKEHLLQEDEVRSLYK